MRNLNKIDSFIKNEKEEVLFVNNMSCRGIQDKIKSNQYTHIINDGEMDIYENKNSQRIILTSTEAGYLIEKVNNQLSKNLEL